MSTTLTVTEALVKLKMSNKKIEDATNYCLVGFMGTSNAVAPAGFKDVPAYKSEVKKRLDSVGGLIKYRDKLKVAIVESNAKTKVTVGSNAMSVAEAIETKTSIKDKKTVLEKLIKNWQALEREITQLNNTLETRADQYVVQCFAQNPSATVEEKSNARQGFIKNNTVLIVTDDNMKNTIESLKNEISEFEGNVDVALSVANATTNITIEA